MTNIPMIKLIEAMNDQPIAFNKHYVFIGCGINGALMLSQLVYWTSRTKNKDGWIYKTHDEWTQETGLTRREQDTARKTLKKLGFLIEKKVGVPCKLHFRVEREKLYKALIKYAESLDSSQLHQTAKLNAPNRQTECTDAPDCMHQTAKLVAQISPTNTENTYREYTENTSGGEIAKNPVDEILEIWTPDLHSLNSWLQRSGEMTMTQNLVNELLLEINAHYEPRIKSGSVNSNQMYSNFVKWVKRDSKRIRERITQHEQNNQMQQTISHPEQPVFKGVSKKFKGMNQ